MADEEQGSSLFEVPEEPLFIRTPRGRLLGIAIAFLIGIILIGVLTGIPLGGTIGLMLIFTGPCAVILVYFLVMFSHVWKAYRYSIWVYIIGYAVAFIASIIIPMLIFYTRK